MLTNIVLCFYKMVLARQGGELWRKSMNLYFFAYFRTWSDTGKWFYMQRFPAGDICGRGEVWCWWCRGTSWHMVLYLLYCDDFGPSLICTVVVFVSVQAMVGYLQESLWLEKNCCVLLRIAPGTQQWYAAPRKIHVNLLSENIRNIQTSWSFKTKGRGPDLCPIHT